MKLKSLNTGEFYISTPKNFNFWRTVYSHGWCALKPFVVDKEKLFLERSFTTRRGKPVYCYLSDTKEGNIKVEYQTEYELHQYEKFDLINQVARVFRLEEDLTEFYTEAKKDHRFKWVYKLKAGRLLRSPTVFEDVVKMICTTNCSWALTELIVNNLTLKLGKKFSVLKRNGADSRVYTFPAPRAIASVDEEYLRKEIRAGYRAPYLLELANRIDSGELDIESWKQPELTTDELFRKVSQIKGVGPYAAGNLLKLLGHYDFLAIDSWCRTKFYKLHKGGRTVSDKSIEKFYNHYGKWRGLFFWLDVTKDWYEHQFPF